MKIIRNPANYGKRISLALQLIESLLRQANNGYVDDDELYQLYKILAPEVSDQDFLICKMGFWGGELYEAQIIKLKKMLAQVDALLEKTGENNEHP